MELLAPTIRFMFVLLDQSGPANRSLRMKSITACSSLLSVKNGDQAWAKRTWLPTAPAVTTAAAASIAPCSPRASRGENAASAVAYNRMR